MEALSENASLRHLYLDTYEIQDCIQAEIRSLLELDPARRFLLNSKE